MANKNFRVRHGLEVAGSATVDADLTVTGNLTVNGTTTTLNTENLLVEDNIVVLNSTVTGSPTLDAGIEVERGTSTNSALTWDEDTDKWYQDRAGTSTVIPISTSELAEGTNEYFTQSRARQSISVTDSGGDGSLSYDNSTGVITYTGPSAAEVRAHFSGGTGVTITDGVVAIGQSVGTGDSPTFAGATAGNITVGLTDNNTITTTNTNGNLTLTPNGTGRVVVSTSLDADLADNTRLLGQMEAHSDTSYTFPAQTLNTISSGSGIISASSLAGTDGYAAGSSITHYFGDTRAGSNTAPAFTFQGANGNSVPSATIPWTGLTGSAASAQSTGGVMGTFNFSTYATSDWASYISGQHQGGGFNVTHPLQLQAYINETPADSTLTISGATITAVSRVSANFANVQVTGTRGQISFNSTTPVVGNAVAVTGTLTGTATGIAAGTYYIIATNGSTTAQLSATPGGYPITTTAGTTTGLTLTRQFITVTYSAQSYIPFGLNAKIAISGFNNVTSGTYMAMGTSTTTSINIGAPSSGAPTLSGSQSLSCSTVTNAGAGFRVRGVPSSTPLNSGNRFNFIDHTAGSATYRSDSFTWAKGAYGGTGTTLATLDSSGNFSPVGRITGYDKVYGEFANTATMTAAAINTIYAMTYDTTNMASDVSIVSNSRITIAKAGQFKIIMSLQTAMQTNSVGSLDFWLRRNGTDVANSATQVDLLKDQKAVVAMDWMVDAAANDYYEIVYAVDDTNLNMPAYATLSTPYVRPAIPSVIVNVIPVGA